MSDSIWKKEISLKRRPKGEDVFAAPPAEGETSIWKREISFRRKPRADAVAAVRPEGETSVWKKEISFRRKPRIEQPAVFEEPAVEPEEPEHAEPVVAEPLEEYGWLTAGLDEETAALDLLDPEPEPEPEPHVDFAPVPVPGTETELEHPVHSLDPVQEPQPSPEPVLAFDPVPADHALADPVPVPGTETELELSVHSFEAVDEPEALLPEPVAAFEPEPVASEPEPVAAKTSFLKREVKLGLPSLKRAQRPEPERDEEKRPFFKRQLKLRGSAKPEPELDTEPSGLKAFLTKDVRIGPKPRGERAERADKVKKPPLWKRDLSFKRAKTEQTDGPKAKKQPIWKRELSLKGDVGIGSLGSANAQKKNQTVVGLKIGASQLAAARIVNNGSPQLMQLARQPLDDGIVVGGELRDLEGLAETLKDFFAKHKLPKKGVRLGIANNRIGVRTFEISGIDDPKQLANAIRFRAQETLPIPLEEAVLDWQVLSETTDPETGVMVRRVLLVVAYRELVDRYVSACKKAGIRLSGIDLEAFAMLRALTPPRADDAPPAEGAQVVVNVGHERSTFAVSDGRICEFTRVLAWGGSALGVAIARALDITPSEAEPIKRALALDGPIAAPENIPVAHLDTALGAVKTELQSFARELVSSLRFYQNQPGSLGIGELVITGGTAHLPGLAAELERLIGVAVRVGDPLGRVKLAKKFKTPEQVGSLAVAIGLGIDD